MTSIERAVLILEHQQSMTLTTGSAFSGLLITMLLLMTVGKE